MMGLDSATKCTSFQTGTRRRQDRWIVTQSVVRRFYDVAANVYGSKTSFIHSKTCGAFSTMHMTTQKNWKTVYITTIGQQLETALEFIVTKDGINKSESAKESQIHVAFQTECCRD